MLSTESQRAAALEQVKREMRSVLITAKAGVPLREIQRDYEMLNCSRLPYKDLGFRDVQSFMSAIRDVAMETRDPMGDIVYKAVADESTAHIQRLVSNQKSITKKRGRGRGRGSFRGGGPSFRGGSSFRGRGGSFNSSYTSFNSRGGASDRGGRGGYSSQRGSMSRPFMREPFNSRGAGNTSSRPPSISTYSSLGAGDWRFKDTGGGGGGQAPPTSHNGHHLNHSIAMTVRKMEAEDGRASRAKEWNQLGCEVVALQPSRHVLGNLGNNKHSSGDGWEDTDLNHNVDGKENKINIMENFKISVNSHGARSTSASSGPGEDEGDLRNMLNEKRKARHASGESEDHRRGVGRGEHAARPTRPSPNENRNEFQKNLPPRFRRMNQEPGQSGSQDADMHDSATASPRRTIHGHIEGGTPVLYTIDRDNWLCPENGELYLQTFRNYFLSRGEDSPDIEIVAGSIKRRSGFYGRMSHCGTLYYPLEILLTEEDARHNVARSFCIQNDIPLMTQTANDRLTSQQQTDSTDQNGAPKWLSQFQALIQPERRNSQDDSSQSPVSIPSRQQILSAMGSHAPPSLLAGTPAKVAPPKAAKVISFDITTGAMMEKTPEASPEKASLHSTKPPTPTQEAPSARKEFPSHTKEAPSHTKEAPSATKEAASATKESPSATKEAPSESSSGCSSSSQVGCPPEVMERVFRMLKPSGLWAKSIPQMYQDTYGDTLEHEFPAAAFQWSDFFTVETLVTGRSVVYPIGSAKDSLPSLTETSSSMVAVVPVPEVVLPPVGSEVEVLFSYAYAAEEVYLQLSQHEDTVYQVDQLLNEQCPTMPPSGTVRPGSMVAAQFEEGWYRAQVMQVMGQEVEVYFIDYGNTELVPLTSLRDVPSVTLILNTQPLAWLCALRKPQVPVGSWVPDAELELAKIVESHKLVARVLAYHNNCSTVDLILPSGDLVNALLLSEDKPREKPASAAAKVTSSDGLDQVKLFNDDPDPLEFPEDSTMYVYVCSVMTESTVLVRFIDADYSDRLEELERQIGENFNVWAKPTKIKKTNVYACVLEVDGEEESEEDGNKYYRARVLGENKEKKTVDVYMPDHGMNETVSPAQLREIDPELNTSLPYQAILATLHGLSSIPPSHRVVAAKALIKLALQGSFVAVNKNLESQQQGGGVDKVTLMRVRKILSVMASPSPAKVAAVYQSVFGEPLANVEDVIKHIPGYGFWKEGLDLELVDTTQEDEDRSINQTVLELVRAVRDREDAGGEGKDVLREMFGSDDEDDEDEDSISKELATAPPSTTAPLTSQSPVPLPPPVSDLDRIARVTDYVRDHAVTPSLPSSPVTPGPHLDPTMPEAIGDCMVTTPAKTTPVNNLKPRHLYSWTNPKLKPKSNDGPNFSYNAPNFSNNVPHISSNVPSDVANYINTPGGLSDTSSEASGPMSDMSHLAQSMGHMTLGQRLGGQQEAMLSGCKPLPVLEDETKLSHLPALPQPYRYPNGEVFHYVKVTYAESPANFVSIPACMSQELTQLQTRLHVHFMNPQEHAQSLSPRCLYAVSKGEGWMRALFRRQIASGIQVYYPDHGTFGFVNPPQLFELPPEFYQMPFLATPMKLGVVPENYPLQKTVAPNTQDWSEASKYFFITKVDQKNFYCAISPEEGSGDAGSATLTVQLVDTSGDADVLIGEMMVDSNYARNV